MDKKSAYNKFLPDSKNTETTVMIISPAARNFWLETFSAERMMFQTVTCKCTSDGKSATRSRVTIEEREKSYIRDQRPWLRPLTVVVWWLSDRPSSEHQTAESALGASE